jgi:hypothetical protein
LLVDNSTAHQTTLLTSVDISENHANLFFWVGMSHFENFRVCDMQNFRRFARMLEEHMLALEAAFVRRVDASRELIAFEEAQTDPEYEAFFLEIVQMFAVSGPKDHMPDALKKAIVVGVKMHHYLKEAQRGGYVTIVKGFFPTWFGCEAAKSHPGVGHVLGLECVNKISKNNMRQVCSVFFFFSNLPHS